MRVGDPGHGLPDDEVIAADINFFVYAWVAGYLSVVDVAASNRWIFAFIQLRLCNLILAPTSGKTLIGVNELDKVKMPAGL